MVLHSALQVELFLACAEIKQECGLLYLLEHQESQFTNPNQGTGVQTPVIMPHIHHQ